MDLYKDVSDANRRKTEEELRAYFRDTSMVTDDAPINGPPMKMTRQIIMKGHRVRRRQVQWMRPMKFVMKSTVNLRRSLAT